MISAFFDTLSFIITTVLPHHTLLLWLLLAYLTLMLIIIQSKKDRSIGNFTWGGFVMIVALYTFLNWYDGSTRQIVATALIMLWGIRLALYAYLRYQKGADPRFIEWQKSKGFFYTLLANFGWIFILNGAMGIVMSLPIICINAFTYKLYALTTLDYIALILWIIGFLFESISDYQLYAFRKNPANRGAVLSSGLWHYSRHPNYFGEIVMWWAIYLFAAYIPGCELTIISPIAITFSLIFVTGIPWLEKAMANNPEYQEYKKRTSMLIPWWAKG